MIDRTDPEVRKLAEEILRLAGPTTHLNYPAQLDDAERRPLAFLTQREAALQGQLHRALGELAGLRGALELAIEALAWASGAPAFGPDGEAREGWKRLGVPAIDGGNTALSASPLSERAGSVLESVGWLIEHQPENGFFFGPAEQSEHQARQEKLADDWYALRAELQKGGDDA